jgi:hypothetical protein
MVADPCVSLNGKVAEARDYKNLECKWHGCGRVTPSSKLRRIGEMIAFVPLSVNTALSLICSDLLSIPFEYHGAVSCTVEGHFSLRG